MRTLARLTLAAFLFLGGIPIAPAAWACIDIAPFEINDIRQADAIFGGKVVRYQRISSKKPNTHRRYGLVTVRVQTVIKGDVAGEVELYWSNSTFGVPESWDSDLPVLVATVRSNRGRLPLRVASGTVFPTERPDLMHVLQAPCSSPFFLDYTTQNIRNIRRILRGEETPPHDYTELRNRAAVEKQKSRIKLLNRLDHQAAIATLLIGAMVVLSVARAWQKIVKSKGK